MIELNRGIPDCFQCSVDHSVVKWDIRVIIYDKSNKIVKSSQEKKEITVDKDLHNVFYIHINVGETSKFERNSNFDLELLSPDKEIFTVHTDKVKIVD